MTEGARPPDIELTVSDDVLTIRAERRQEERVEEKDRFRSEFRYKAEAVKVPVQRGRRHGTRRGEGGSNG